METLNVDFAKWISNELLKPTKGDFKVFGSTIGQNIPPTFESYCKIFHPFGITLDEPEGLRPNSKKGKLLTSSMEIGEKKEIIITEKDSEGKEIDLLQDFIQRKEDHNLKFFKYISWKNIANKYGLSFHSQINIQSFVAKFKNIGWPTNLNFPKEGRLPRQILVKLIEILKKGTIKNEVFIYQTAPHTIWKGGKDCDLVKCTFEDILKYFEEDFIGYLYSSDKSWIVYTNNDLHFTIVGAKKSIITNIANSELEAIECNANTRTDYYSDKINPGVNT